MVVHRNSEEGETTDEAEDTGREDGGDGHHGNEMSSVGDVEEQKRDDMDEDYAKDEEYKEEEAGTVCRNADSHGANVQCLRRRGGAARTRWRC